MTELLGYSHEEFLKKQLWEIGLFSDKSENQSAVRELQANGYIRFEHLPLVSKDARRVEVEVVANAYREGGHQVIQCNIRDITERSRLEKLLQQQSLELFELHRRKDEFLAMLSHELRSPLAPIANAVQLLGLHRAVENSVQAQARSIIGRQLTKLERLVDDLLEVSRITTGRVQLRKERTLIGIIVHNAVETARPLIQQLGHDFKMSTPVEPIWLLADPARLEQVVENLLTNAAKYTPRSGKIWLDVSREGNDCVVKIRDTGVGISPAILPTVFDLFTQGERSLDRSQGGLGIGLALVKRLTELHGGTVEVESTPGVGSQFTIRLPVLLDETPGHEQSVVPDSPLAGRSYRVMVVDDNVDTVLSLAMLLKAEGHIVQTAQDGLATLRTALDFHPDVILLDIGLPGLNGYEVAKRIREEPTLCNVVLIAMTGYGHEKDRAASTQAGFNHHLVKPAKFAEVKSILESQLEGRKEV